jgi:hypothetical protein
MARIQEEILEAFYERLCVSENVGPATVAELRRLFSSGDKLKAEDFIATLSKEKTKDTM